MRQFLVAALFAALLSPAQAAAPAELFDFWLGVGEQLEAQRMRFYDIEPDSFDEDGEGSTDGGKTWTLIWRLHHQRTRSCACP